MSASDMRSTADILVGELLRDESPSLDDLDNLNDQLSERVYQTADNLCSYYSDCQEYINKLESDYGNDVDLGEATYTADNWQTAMSRYAYALVESALSSEAVNALDAIKENIELFTAEVERLDGDVNGAELSSDCQYGWEAHNYETNKGVMIWSNERNNANGCFNPNLLEGELIAVSFEVAPGCWANIAWTPESD